MRRLPCHSQLPFASTSPAQCTATFLNLVTIYIIIALHHNDIISSITLTCVSHHLVGSSRPRMHLLVAAVPHPLSCNWSTFFVLLKK